MNDVGPIRLYSLRLELVDLAAVHSLPWPLLADLVGDELVEGAI